jgi:hypothetical protein
LAASSYFVSGNLLRRVVASFEPGVAVFCDASNIMRRPPLRKLRDGLRSFLALEPALIFALRARSTLIKAGAGQVESNRAAQSALIHAIHRPVARAILKKVKPRCVVIGNGNRPFEFSLWAEARARGVATVLLPFAEISLKPARFLSLCRGAFDLALPFSEYSAEQIRKLRPDVRVEVVGFPLGLNAVGSANGEVEKTGSNGAKILYIGGNNFEKAASAIIREALANSDGLRLRVRLHPRNRGAEIRELFSWLPEDCVSDPMHTPLADDIAISDIVVAVRSTAALDAMIAGVPFVWLSPRAHRHQLEFHPIRQQKLALFDATTSMELRAVVQRLIDDKSERKRVVEAQWSRLLGAGYGGDYFGAVRSVLCRLIGSDIGSPTATH